MTFATLTTTTVLDVVVPVHNEERDLAPCVRELHADLVRTFPYSFRITIADNASTDGTADVADGLARELPGVTAVHLAEKGRGRALKAVWSASDAAVLAYMDVDLSTDLAALAPLTASLISGHSDLAIGSRLARGARVVRGPKREFVSRCYNLILRGALATRFTDAQCGFKAIRADVARRLLPHVEDTGWFFDTELLVLAERAGARIHEVPVDWVDDPDSRVDIVSTAIADLRGVARVGRGLVTGRIPIGELSAQLGRRPLEPHAPGVPAGLVRQLVRFAAVGAVSTLAYLLLFVLLRGGLGAQGANLVALLVTAVANTAANRRFTFGVRGSRGAGRHQFEGLVVFGLGLALTSGALAVLHRFTPPGGAADLAAVVGANLLATVLRFLLLRNWVFRARRGRDTTAGTTAGTTADGRPTTPDPTLESTR
ncbi:bifunctional glycosyltransferase family 2/GtrA family protein [Saccharothrix longispora]|uniref:bifunctional glycosyltransferase family 2/GtrA family protein n=1 Tax=Saccharothrix longispora TaxID=33920 RepID=UPI0028FD7C72|nr:bifunctional glycosyltransferase family 2/GtrA family protein [Saccharothrix longispora]MDU0293667.1 bifunctional glycosyltransferase family 2/GtrA family protein [Saccharothrix longispora]